MFDNFNENIKNETIILIWIICGQIEICFFQVIQKGAFVKVLTVSLVKQSLGQA